MLVLKILLAVVTLGVLYLIGHSVGYLCYNLFDRFRNTMKSIKR